MHPVWKLEAYDRAGAVIGTISKAPDGAVIMEGTTDAFALCLPDLRKVPTFFTDPEAVGRAAFEAYIAAAPESAWGYNTWDEIKSSDKSDCFVARWIAAGMAAINVPTT